jgi:hypothetical protein
MTDSLVITSTAIQTVETPAGIVEITTPVVEVVSVGTQGASGVGVPAGGTTGQALVKASGDDYDTEWADPSGGGTPAGSNTQIQYNNAGAFGASANFTWTESTRTLLARNTTSPASETYIIAGEANFGRRFGMFIQAGGNEGGFKADSAFFMKANSGVVIQGGANALGTINFSQNAAFDPRITSNTGNIEIGASNLHNVYMINKVRAKTASVPAAVFIARTGQTANLIEVQDASGNNNLFIDNTYQLAFRADAASGNKIYFGSFNSFTGGSAGFSVPGNAIFAVNGQHLKIGIGGGLHFLSNAPSGLLHVKGKANEIQEVIQGNATQTANLTEWQNSAGTVLASISAAGNLRLGAGSVNYLDATSGNFRIYSGDGSLAWQSGSTTQAFFKNATFTPTSAAGIPLAVKGAASQTANLQEWQNSAGTILARVNADGTFGTGYGNGGFKPVVIGTGAFSNYSAMAVTNFFGAITGFIVGNNNGLLSFVNPSGNLIYSLPAVGTRVTFDVISTTGAGFNFAPSIMMDSTSGSECGFYLPLGVGANTIGIATARTERLRIGATGNILINGFTASTVGQIIRAAASQTANLQEWQNSAGTALASMSAAGQLTTSSLVDLTGYARIRKAGTPTSTPNVWRVEADTEAGNTNNTALYIYGEQSGARVYLGKSGLPIGSLNLINCASIENMPSFNTSGLNFGGAVGGQSHLITRNSNDIFIRASGPSANIVFHVGNPTFGTSSEIFRVRANGLLITAPTASSVPTIMRGAASQTNNLQEWQNSSGTSLASITAAGSLFFQNVGFAQIDTATIELNNGVTGGTRDLKLRGIELTGNVTLGTGTGTKIGTTASQKLGFWNAAPVVRDNGWTTTNVTTDRSFDANATTIDELADVVGTLIEQLKTYGLLGA